jgi:predicted HTH domain antitoxin
MSSAVRELVDLGRVMLAVDRYKNGEASLEKAAKLAGVSLSKLMDILASYGVEANLTHEDYLQSLKTVRKVW